MKPAEMLAFFVLREMYSVYILYSTSLDKHYIGYSNNVVSRLAYHNDVNRNAIWTKRGIPWELYFRIDGLSEKQAIMLERHIKKMKSRKYISNLKKYPELVEKVKNKFG